MDNEEDKLLGPGEIESDGDIILSEHITLSEDLS